MRAWISAELDGELSEFESVLLHGHLGRCDSCSTFKADAAAVAAALRGAPLELMSRPVAVSHRRRIALPLRVPVAAAAAVTMIAFGSLFASLHSGGILADSNRTSAAAFDDLRQLQRQKGPAALAQLRVRQAEVTSGSAQTSPHTGFQNP